MSIEELKKLFDKYSLDTLDSFDLVLKNAKDLDLTNTNIAFNSIFQKKYEKDICNFEGRNEYDYITRLLKFNISEIIDNIDLLNHKEIKYLSTIADNALSNINQKNRLKNSYIIYSLEKLKKESNLFKYYSRNTTSTIGEDLTDEELINLFKKYDKFELEAFGIIFEYASFDYNVYRLYKIAKKVYESKNIYDEIPKESPLSEIKNKNHILTEKELNLLEKLTDSASNCLDSIQDNNVEYEKIAVFQLNESINKELSNRKSLKKLIIKK